MSDLYDTDGYTWAMRQADALRRRSANEVDWDNVAEEIESVGRSQESKLYSRYAVLLMHLLKWLHQPEARSRSWEASIRTQRLALERLLRKNPGLKGGQSEAFQDAYEVARIETAAETGLVLDTFPETSPFTLAEAADEDFWPGPPSEN